MIIAVSLFFFFPYPGSYWIVTYSVFLSWLTLPRLAIAKQQCKLRKLGSSGTFHPSQASGQILISAGLAWSGTVSKKHHKGALIRFASDTSIPHLQFNCWSITRELFTRISSCRKADLETWEVGERGNKRNPGQKNILN